MRDFSILHYFRFYYATWDALIVPLWKLSILCNFFSGIRFFRLENFKTGPSWSFSNFPENCLENEGWGALFWARTIFFGFYGKFYKRNVSSDIWKKIFFLERIWIEKCQFSQKTENKKTLSPGISAPRRPKKKKKIGYCSAWLQKDFLKFWRISIFWPRWVEINRPIYGWFSQKLKCSEANVWA